MYHTLLNGGLVFFSGLGVSLITLAILEKFGIEINTTLLRIIMVGGILGSFVWSILKNPIILSLF